jgi:hypothetical protein
MNTTRLELRQRLLGMEEVTPSLKQRYNQEIQAMLEKKLTGIGRWVWLATAIGGLAFAVLFGTLAVTEAAGFPWSGRLGFAGGALFGIGWAVLGIRVFRRGALDLKFDTGAVAGMSWIFPVFLVTLFMVSAPNSIAGLRMIVSGVVFLIIGAVFLIGNMVTQSTLRSREKLLEIEYRLAELTEAVKLDRPLPPPQG